VRDYVVGLLLPRERNKTLTCLAGAEPVTEAGHREVQRLQWFLSQSPWEHEPVTERRIAVVNADPATASHGGGGLLLDDSGDRKAGHATDYVSRQYIGSRAAVAGGIVAVTTCWADERVYYPLHTIPYQPASRLPGGRADPDFRTKGQIATDLVTRAVAAGIRFRALVADCFYGPSESPRFIDDLDAAGIPFVVALKPGQPITGPGEGTTTPARAAAALGFGSAAKPKPWRRVTRVYRDGHRERWWSAELPIGPYGPGKPRRLIVATSDPARLPATSTWYLATNLPRRRHGGAPPPATHAEIVRLYSLRGWIEQDYKQVKHELGWADFQVRAGHAIQRHWALVNLAFTYCWWQAQPPGSGTGTPAAAIEWSWNGCLRDVRSWLTPWRDLHRLLATGLLALTIPAVADLAQLLAAGTGIHLYLPP
jgi:SRSO17 transposase